ncbi:Uncharacterised protein [Vibrio cholerae]|nr:Uncharacterised protein [Vibrio cholerae]CSB84369.1 Uncharacterised protein [Vibrio cholerae]
MAIHRGCVLLELLIIFVASRFLQQVNRFWVKQMLLTTLFPLIHAADIQHLQWDFTRWVTNAMTNQHFFSDVVEGQTLNTGDGASEVFIDHRFTDPERFKNLCTVIRLQRRNPHFREDLQQTAVHAFTVILEVFLYRNIGIEFLLTLEIDDGFHH